MEERERHLARFATSVFHAFAHIWTCQLEYNPRLLPGFGLTNGEGMERVWSALAPLIPANRVSTAANRRMGLHLWTENMNNRKLIELGEFNACLEGYQMNGIELTPWPAGTLNARTKRTQANLTTVERQLDELQAKRSDLTEAVLCCQWEKQKQAQLTPRADASNLLSEKEEQQVAWLQIHNRITSLQQSGIIKRPQELLDLLRAAAALDEQCDASALAEDGRIVLQRKAQLQSLWRLKQRLRQNTRSAKMA